MGLFINVPFEEKDEAKALGARWNKELKKWYVDKREDYYKFSKWIMRDNKLALVLCDHFYIVEGKHTCFRCGKTTTVIGFGIQNYIELESPVFCSDSYVAEYSITCSNKIHITDFIEPLSDRLLDVLKNRYKYYEDDSKSADAKYFANHCNNCNVIQGRFYLFEEEDTPFFINSKEKASQLTLHKIKLENDIIVSADCEYDSDNYLVTDHAHIDNFQF